VSTKVPKTSSKAFVKTFPGVKVIPTNTLQKSSVGNFGSTISKLWISEGHPIDRKTGHRVGGGPFHVTHTGPYIRFGHVDGVFGGNNLELLYSGPVYGIQQHATAVKEHYDSSTPSTMDETSMNADGATAISLVAPTNPTANLGTSLAEIYKEGFPSLPGIQSWKARTRFLKGLGSEYLNYQFALSPLQSEVHDVVNAARYHRDIMQNYEHNEGRNIHRRFDFSPEVTEFTEELPPGFAILPLNATYLAGGSEPNSATVVVRCRKERKRWFEGCFTYGGPGESDKFSDHIGFGREADAVYGLSLTPSTLWELTPWSWAVDWFTNAGDVINNITNFANAGLVMRYGYMMEESINTYYTEYGENLWRVYDSYKPTKKSHPDRMGGCSIGQKTVRKSRCPANPFGFGVGWEGLSPTQLAITAALGITRVLK
jgi:hypothetical protein